MSLQHTTPSVSVLVCTRNRAARLPDLLAALEDLDLTGVREFEVVIIDNGSTDNTQSFVQDWASRSSLTAKVLVEKRLGLCRAKNLAIQVSSGDLIICTDDDCIPARDWVQSFLKVFDGNLMQFIGGRVELHDKNDAKITIKTDTVPGRLTSPVGLLGFAHGCNMSFGRGVVDAIGPFDVRFGPGTKCFAAEDTDFAYRVHKAGFPVRYEPEPVVYHNHGRSRSQQHYSIVAKYHFGFGAMAMKHLLEGKTDLVRPLYWSMRNVIRNWRSGVYGFEMGITASRFVTGAFHFLLYQSWRRTDL